jgi:hypothetical protein
VTDQSKFGPMPGATPGGGGLRCEEWEALLADALDGLLPAGQAAAFRAHSETCANCGDLLAHAEQGREWLGYLHTEPEIPAGLISRILDKTVGAGAIPLPVVTQDGQGTGAIAMPWRRTFHETRLLMTIAMAFFSIALTLNLVGVKPGNIRLSDLRPSQVGSTLSRGFFTARGSVVRYYDNLRFVYQLQSRMRELRRDVETQPANQQQPETQKKQEPSKQGGSGAGSGNKDGWLNEAPVRGGVLNASERSACSVQRSKGRAGYRVQGAGFSEQPAEERSAFGVRSVKQATQSTDKNEATEVQVSAGTGKSISLGQQGTGLQEAVETAGYVGRSLV